MEPSQRHVKRGGQPVQVDSQISVLPEPFQVFREDVEQVEVVVVTGEVDMFTAPALREELGRVRTDRAVVLDLCRTAFMDSSGLAVVFDAARKHPGGVHIACAPRGAIRRLVDVSHVATAVRLYGTLEEAIANAR
jgi:anti-sigma B factor antagonist